jgi:non-heme chloroperoxidase
MHDHAISGGGGVRLHVVETGNPAGRPVLFIHGFSQCSLSWTRQLNSDLASDYRLLAIDLRGHGLSEKPKDSYGDSKLWADDIDAVIRTLNLDRPVLCGWSYGPLVILDYVRHYGEKAIGGVVFVAGVSRLGSEAALAVITPAFLGLVPGFFSTNVEESTRSLQSLIDLCCAQPLARAEMSLMLGFNVLVPPHVRQALFARTIDNDDVMATLRKPVLLVHGNEDAAVQPLATEQHHALIPHAQVQLIPGIGHAPFWEDPRGFNDTMRRFCEHVDAELQRASELRTESEATVRPSLPREPGPTLSA